MTLSLGLGGQENPFKQLSPRSSLLHGAQLFRGAFWAIQALGLAIQEGLFKQLKSGCPHCSAIPGINLTIAVCFICEPYGFVVHP